MPLQQNRTIDLDHLAPIWQALDPAERGTLYLAGRLADEAGQHGVPAVRLGYPSPGQRPVLVASYKDELLAQRPVVYLEHGAGQSYCLAPATRVLTQDLRWLPIADLQPGHWLVGFERDSWSRNWRRWQPAQVLEARPIRLPAYHLRLADGTEIVASADHRWLTRDRQMYEWSKTENLQDAHRWPRRSTKIIKGFEVWDEDRSWEAGYLAGAFDGEGCFTQTRREPRQSRVMLAFSQRDNDMLALVKKELEARGFRYSEVTNGGTHKTVHQLWVRGGTREVLRFLGSIRPRRLISNLKPLDTGQMRGQPVELLKMDYLGEQELVAIRTSTGTFFAEGFASHNCDLEDPSYSGSAGHDRCRLFLCPSETVAERWRSCYPDTPAVAVGCAKLDWRHRRLLSGHDRSRLSPPARSVVAVSFHSDLVTGCPETRSAYRYYDPVLADVAARFKVLGHAHPRLWPFMVDRWRQLGVEAVASFDEILNRAECYVVDNSSTLWEAASCGLPTVALSMPAYRRDVDHGLRFWSHIPGVHVERPEDLIAGIHLALDDSEFLRQRRLDTVAKVYVATDGHATDRAVDAIRAVLSSTPADAATSTLGP